MVIQQRGRSRLRRRLTFTFSACTLQPPSNMQRIRYARSFCVALVLAAALGRRAGAVRSGWCFFGYVHAGNTLELARRRAPRLPCACCFPQRTCPAHSRLLERAFTDEPADAINPARTRFVSVTAPKGSAEVQHAWICTDNALQRRWMPPAGPRGGRRAS